MAGTGIEYDASRAIKGLSGAAREARATRVSRLIGVDLLKWINDNFRQQGIERKWAKLSQSTIMQRREGPGGGSPNILRDTGTLAQSFVQAGGGANPTAGPQGVFVFQSDQVTVGTQVEYAKYHEEGTSPYTIRPKSKKVLAWKLAGDHVVARMVNHPGLPRRPILPSKAKAEEIAATLIDAVIDKAAKKVK